MIIILFTFFFIVLQLVGFINGSNYNTTETNYYLGTGGNAMTYSLQPGDFLPTYWVDTPAADQTTGEETVFNDPTLFDIFYEIITIDKD